MLSDELKRCGDCVQQCVSEVRLSRFVRRSSASIGVIVAEGFEERSLGLLRKLAAQSDHKIIIDVVIGRYDDALEDNKRFREEFEQLASSLTGRDPTVLGIDVDGEWFAQALDIVDGDTVVTDITGVSNKSLFAVLDTAQSHDRPIFVSYTEARLYWPIRNDWRKLLREVSNPSEIAAAVDSMPWLFGHEHVVEFVLGHEGYDSGAGQLALIGFLPFKCARLGSVLSEIDYDNYTFIAGRPRLKNNSWRLSALKRINEPLINDWPTIEIDTFGYANTVRCLTGVLAENRLLQTCDVHVAILGSKLQTVGTWLVSSMIPALTMLDAVPMEYFPDAFSDGVGESWVFPLPHPVS